MGSGRKKRRGVGEKRDTKEKGERSGRIAGGRREGVRSRARNKDWVLVSIIGQDLLGHNRKPMGFMSKQMGIWSVALPFWSENGLWPAAISGSEGG